MDISIQKAYLSAFRGKFSSTMRWHDLDAFWQVLKMHADDRWYIYTVGKVTPEFTVNKTCFLTFIDNIDSLLHKKHKKDYCGIVYVDNKNAPEFIKIYDPNNLGVSCGFSDNPPLPGWILSRLQPVDLSVALTSSSDRKRWWQKLFQ